MTVSALDTFEMLDALLGDPPEDLRPPPHANLRRILDPGSWPEDFQGLTFFFRALDLLLRERGGTLEAARSIRQDLQSGALPAVLVFDDDGEEHAIDRHRWRGTESSRLYWCGAALVPRKSGDLSQGNIYIRIPQPAADHLTQRERGTVARLIYGLALVAYAQDKHGLAAEIARDLEACGFKVSRDTVAKWLDLGREHYDPASDTRRNPNSDSSRRRKS